MQLVGNKQGTGASWNVPKHQRQPSPPVSPSHGYVYVNESELISH